MVLWDIAVEDRDAKVAGLKLFFNVLLWGKRVYLYVFPGGEILLDKGKWFYLNGPSI
jgi:hypothetical protein